MLAAAPARHLLWRNLPNSISGARLLTSAALLPLALLHQPHLYQWLLLGCLLSDVLDGPLARRLKLTSPQGALLDSIADIGTMLAAVTGILTFHQAFVSEHFVGLILVMSLYAVEVAVALCRYGRASSFHTILARVAAVMAGVFVMTLFFNFASGPLYQATVLAFTLALSEELLLLLLLPEWTTNVRGLYWVLTRSDKS